MILAKKVNNFVSNLKGHFKTVSGLFEECWKHVSISSVVRLKKYDLPVKLS